MRRTIRWATMVSALLVASYAFPSSLSNLVRGTILDDDGKALSEVKVAFYPLGKSGKQVTTYTDRKGTYVTLGLPEGRYRVIAARKGYAPAVKEMLDVSPKAVRSLDFRLRPSEMLKLEKNRNKAPWILRTLDRDILRLNNEETRPWLDRATAETASGGGFGGSFMFQDSLGGSYGRGSDAFAPRDADRLSFSVGLKSPELELDGYVKGSRYRAADGDPELLRSINSRSLQYGVRYDDQERGLLGLEGEVFRSSLLSRPQGINEHFSQAILSWHSAKDDDLAMKLRLGYVGGSLWLDDAPGFSADMALEPGAWLLVPSGERLQDGSLLFVQGEVSRPVEGVGTLKAEAEVVSSAGEPMVRSFFLRSVTPEQVTALGGLDPVAPWSVLLKGEVSVDLFELLWISPALSLYHAPGSGDNLIFIPQIGLTYLPDDRTEMSATVLYNGITPLRNSDDPDGPLFSMTPASTLPPSLGCGLAVRRDLGALGDLGLMVKVNEVYVPVLDTPNVDRSLQGRDFIVLRSGASHSTEYGIELRSELIPGISSALSSSFGKAEGRVRIVPLESSIAEPLWVPADDSASRFFMASMRTSIDRTRTSVGVLFKWADQTSLARPDGDTASRTPAELSLVDLSITQGLTFLDFTEARWKLLFGVRDFFVDALGSQGDGLSVFATEPSRTREITGGVSITF